MSLYLTMTQRNQWSDSLSDSTATRQSRHSPHLPHSLHGWYRWPMKDTFAGNPAGKPNPRTKVPDFPQLQHRQLQAGTFGHRLIFSQRQCFPTDACVIIPRGLRGVRRAHAGAKRGTLPRSTCAESLVIGIVITGEQEEVGAVDWRHRNDTNRVPTFQRVFPRRRS